MESAIDMLTEELEKFYENKELYSNALSRYKKFIALSPIVQNLIMLLYKNNPKLYLESYFHPLEDYIIEFNNFMDDEADVRRLGLRIGLLIPITHRFDARDMFVDMIVSYIKNVENNMINRVNTDGFPSTVDIIQMSRNDFKKYADKYGFENTLTNYLNRMNLFELVYSSELLPQTS